MPIEAAAPKIGHMAVPNIGGVPAVHEQRDAIHMAVAPVVAAATLLPGQRVGLMPDGRAAVVVPFVGVVDPFLQAPVAPGSRFWLFIEPNTITSLRHQWTHPAFVGELDEPATDPRSEAEAWLRSFAADVGVQYERMMSAAAHEIKRPGDYPIVLSYDTPERVWQDSAEFWKRYKILVPSAPVKDGYDNTFITCSC